MPLDRLEVDLGQASLVVVGHGQGHGPLGPLLVGELARPHLPEQGEVFIEGNPESQAGLSHDDGEPGPALVAGALDPDDGLEAEGSPGGAPMEVGGGFVEPADLLRLHAGHGQQARGLGMLHVPDEVVEEEVDLAEELGHLAVDADLLEGSQEAIPGAAGVDEELGGAMGIAGGGVLHRLGHEVPEGLRGGDILGQGVGQDEIPALARHQDHPGPDPLAGDLDPAGELPVVGLPGVDLDREPEQAVSRGRRRARRGAGPRPGLLRVLRPGAHPGKCARGRLPCPELGRDIKDGVILAAGAVERRLARGEGLPPEEVFGHVLVGLLRGLEQLPRARPVAGPAVCDQGPGVGPGRGFLVVAVEEFSELAQLVEIEQPAREDVSEPLVVGGVEPEEVAQVIGGRDAEARGPERLGQVGPGPHIGAGLRDRPELPRRAGEDLRAEHARGRVHGPLVQLDRLPPAPGLLGQDQVGVGAVRVELEGLAGDRHPNLGIARVHGAVRHRLRPIERRRLDDLASFR